MRADGSWRQHPGHRDGHGQHPGQIELRRPPRVRDERSDRQAEHAREDDAEVFGLDVEPRHRHTLSSVRAPVPRSGDGGIIASRRHAVSAK